MTIRKILIVDDNATYCEALKNLLERDPTYAIIGIAHDGRQGLELAREKRPDICFIDIEMPEVDGTVLVRNLRTEKHPCKVIMISQEGEHDRLANLSQLEVDGHLLKSDESDEILAAVKSVTSGERYFSRSIGEKLYDGLKERGSHRPAPREIGTQKKISEREIQIASLVSEGLSNKEIAQRLECSENTIKTHKANIMRKIGAKNSVEISRWYLNLGPKSQNA